MPIFGHDANDETRAETLENRLRGSVHQAPVDCIATSITMKLRVTTAAKKVKCAIYGPTEDDVTSPYAWALIAETEEKTVPVQAATWTQFDFLAASRPTLTDGKTYWLCAVGESGEGALVFYVKIVAVETGDCRTQGHTYANSLPNPSNCADCISYTQEGGNDLQALIYCTYEIASDPTSPTESASGLWPRETYISGYLPRYQKRQVIGYHAASGDLRSVEINASGHIITDVSLNISGLDIEVNISGDPVIISGQPVIISGQPVIISGQHVHLESGDTINVFVKSGSEMTVLSGTPINISGQPVIISGQPVIISGQHVHLESGDTINVFVKSGSEIAVISGTPINISGQPVIISGQPVTISGDHVFVESGIARLHGYHPASGIWVPIAVTLSGCIAMTFCLSGGLF